MSLVDGRSAETNSSENIGMVRLLAHPTDSYFRLFIFPCAQRFFIASESRRLPSGVEPPRLRLFVFVVLPLGLPRRFFPRAEEVDPKSAPMARLKRSRSFVKSETNFATSNACRLLPLLE